MDCATVCSEAAHASEAIVPVLFCDDDTDVMLI